MTTDENYALYQRIRSGDNSAVAEMIERNMPLVKSRVGLFLKEYRRFRHLFDDLYGEGILALTEAVNSFKERDIAKPTGFVVSAIDYALKNYVDAEIGAGLMSRSSVQRRRSRDESLPNQLPIDVARPPARIWQNATGRVVRKAIEHETAENEISDSDIPASQFGVKTKGVSHADAEQFIAQFEQDGATDLLETILTCCESDEEREIVRLRIYGYTDEEIGEQLGISRQTVGRRRERIEERFETKKAAQ